VEHQIELTAESLWDEVSSRLRGALNEATFGTWFGDAAGASLSDDAFSLAVPNDFTREWIEGHFLGLIRAAVKDATGHERRIHLTVRDDMVPRPEPVSDGALLEQPVTRAPEPAAPGSMSLKYTFDLFVIGSSNRLAHAAALAVAEAPAQSYNPLLFY
jgi:chromosomal replication initiator protein